MLKFLVRKANGLLQTHLGGGEPQERGTGLSPYFFFLATQPGNSFSEHVATF